MSLPTGKYGHRMMVPLRCQQMRLLRRSGARQSTFVPSASQAALQHKSPEPAITAFPSLRSASLSSLRSQHPTGRNIGQLSHARRHYAVAAGRASPGSETSSVAKGVDRSNRRDAERLDTPSEDTKVASSMKRVVVGLSGGVDSAVAAMLLKRQGYEVVGVFMRNWDAQDETGSDVCTADADLEDAKMVGRHLGIPVETVDFSREYWHSVFAPSVEEFARCRTPNPDVSCNRFIKFDAFTKHATGRLGADLVATGHYARVGPGPEGNWESPVLLQAKDTNKDQTYFLCSVPASSLAKVLFPLGGLTKPEVRELALKAGLPVARKRESMGVCFVGKRRSWADFLSHYLTPSPGNFVCVDTGTVMGRHEGVQLYTVGQKSQLDGMSEKWYVAGLDVESNSVIVAKGALHPTLFSRGLSTLASEFRWVAGVPPSELASSTSRADGVGRTSASGEREENLHRSKGKQNREDTNIQDDAQREHIALAVRQGLSPEAEQGRLRCLYRCRHRQTLMPCTVELSAGDDVISPDNPIVDTATDNRKRSSTRADSASQIRATRTGAAGVVVPDNSDSNGSGDVVSSRSGASPAPLPPCVGSESASTAMTSVEANSVENRNIREAPPLLSPVPPPTSSPASSSQAATLITVRFDEPAKAVTPGQVVALYKDGICLGGGPILRAEDHCSPVLLRPPPPPPRVSASRRKRYLQAGIRNAIG